MDQSSWIARELRVCYRTLSRKSVDLYSAGIGERFPKWKSEVANLVCPGLSLESDVTPGPVETVTGWSSYWLDAQIRKRNKDVTPMAQRSGDSSVFFLRCQRIVNLPGA